MTEQKFYAVVLAGEHAGKVINQDQLLPEIQLPVIPVYSLQDFKEGKELDLTPVELKNYVIIELLGKGYYIPKEWTASDPTLAISNYIEQLIKDQAQ